MNIFVKVIHKNVKRIKRIGINFFNDTIINKISEQAIRFLRLLLCASGGSLFRNLLRGCEVVEEKKLILFHPLTNFLKEINSL